MAEMNVYWFWWISTLVNPLKSFMPGTPLMALATPLGLARVGLDMMSNVPGAPFPRTAARMKELMAVIDGIIPPQQQHERLNESSAYYLNNGARLIETTLEEEARHSYVICVQDQRCLSAYSLVEKIESCFSASGWTVIQDDARSEFEECGKCLAFERYTAAGFHSLRGVECVIRQFILDLAGSLPKKRDWYSYIETLRTHNADSSLISVLDNMRTLERNPLMHPEDWLDIDEAIAIFNLSQTAVLRLTNDMRKKLPQKYGHK